jgi:hypothetical protein
MKIFVGLLFLMATSAFAVDQMPLGNPQVDGDVCVYANKSVGGVTNVMCVDGATAKITYPEGGVPQLDYQGDWRSVGTVGAVANDQQELTYADDFNTLDVAYWHLAGDANDDSGQNECSAAACNLTGTAPDYLGKGFFGRENIAEFDGVSHGLLSNDAFFDPNDENYSVGAWFKADSDIGAIFAQRDTVSNASFMAYVNPSNGNLYCSAYGGGWVEKNISFEYGKWHHVAQTFDTSDNTVRCYLDGQLFASSTVAVVQVGANRLFTVGYHSTAPAGLFKGRIQDVFYGKMLLTDAQVNAIYSRRFQNANQLAGGHILAASSFPWTSLEDKMAFWNLSSTTADDSGATACSGGNGSCGLTNNNSAPFDGTNIFGEANSAINLNGTTQFLSHTDAFLDPFRNGPASFFMGGWFGGPWSGSTRMLLACSGGAVNADNAFEISTGTAGSDLRFTYNNAGTTTSFPEFAHGVDGGWQHVGIRWHNGFYYIYFNGSEVAKVAGIPGSTDCKFSVGARPSVTPERFWEGPVHDIAYIKAYVSEWDIKKLASSKIATSLSVTPEYQHWDGTWKREDGQIHADMVGWILDKRSTELFLFPGLDAGDQIRLQMQQVK